MGLVKQFGQMVRKASIFQRATADTSPTQLPKERGAGTPRPRYDQTDGPPLFGPTGSLPGSGGNPIPGQPWQAESGARFDDSMGRIEPTRPAGDRLGLHGSPMPADSYGSGLAHDALRDSDTGYPSGHGDSRSTQRDSVETHHQPYPQRPQPRPSLSNLAARAQHLPSPTNPAAMAKQLFGQATTNPRAWR